MRRARSASADEIKLWRNTMRDVVPLSGVKPEAPPTPSFAALLDMKVVPERYIPPPAVVPALPERPQGPANGVDRQTLRRLGKGERHIEATIDLHGMTLDMAYAALRRFVDLQAFADKRCLLVITGKGGPFHPGRLKQEVPLWLAEWRPPVMAVVPAAPRHGGHGAFYVLLQRRR